MHCPECGTNNSDSAKFCENCGTPLVGAAVSEEVIEETVEIPAASPEQPTEQIPDPLDQTKQIPDPKPQGEDPFAPGQTRAIPQQPAPPQGAPSAPAKSNGKAIASLVCGIAAIVLSGSILLGIILGIVAIVLAAQAVKEGPDGKAKAGKICGIVGLAFSALTLILAIVSGVAIFNFIEQNPSLVTIEISSSKSISSSATSSSGLSSKSSSAPSSSNATSKSSSSDVYKNTRFGYSLALPSGFTKIAEASNGDGATFDNKSLGVTAKIAGTNNSNGLTPERYVETKWKGSSDAWMENDDNCALLYQVEGDTATFYYAFVGAGSINELIVTYPAPGTDAQLDAAEALVMGLTPGSIASSH